MFIKIKVFVIIILLTAAFHEKPIHAEASVLGVVSSCGMATTALIPAVYACYITTQENNIDWHLRVAACVLGFTYDTFQFMPCACALCDYFEKDCPGC